MKRSKLSHLDRVLTVMTAAVIVCMMLHVTTHALSRFLLGAPLPATNELIEFLYVPLVALLGLPAALLQREHITATLVVDRMKKANALVFRGFACLVGMALCALFAYFGFFEALHRMQVGATAGITTITIWPVYYVVPLVFALMSGLYAYTLYLIVVRKELEPQLITSPS
ncbi:TRAP transporter small permease [Nesterenkonia sp. LB17]|uniref:TRAP transporter small permease n=1 Tax=Nesterenkonia sp. LB17 TaxID=2901230 RepID=UPI001F4CE574|nr:TRAP transporter small permease [Nesterenkonia sp. LB17]